MDPIRKIASKNLQDLTKKLESLAVSRVPYEVFQNLITLSACAFGNRWPNKDHSAKEKLYMDTIGRYSLKEQLVLPEILGLLAMLADEHSDHRVDWMIFELRLHLMTGWP